MGLKAAKIRNEGAYLLGRVGLPDAVIAARIACSRPQVTNYRLCKLKPRRVNRTALHVEFGIPEEAWDRPYSAPAEPAAVNGLNGHGMATGDIGPDVLKALILDTVKALGSSATPYERLRIMRSATDTLTALGKLTGETLDMPEEKILRLPAYRKLKAQILEALRPWPEAIHALAQYLGEVEE